MCLASLPPVRVRPIALQAARWRGRLESDRAAQLTAPLWRCCADLTARVCAARVDGRGPRPAAEPVVARPGSCGPQREAEPRPVPVSRRCDGPGARVLVIKSGGPPGLVTRPGSGGPEFVPDHLNPASVYVTSESSRWDRDQHCAVPEWSGPAVQECRFRRERS